MNIYNFYNNIGWEKGNKISKDAELFEDLRQCAKIYVSKCRKKINKFIPRKGSHILDFASGPIQYREYLAYSKNFKIRHCVDFSKSAIKEAKKKIGKKGKFYSKNFFNIEFKENFFDCVVSLHTVYHIPKKKQKKAVIKLIKITKKNKPVIIVYSNPKTLISRIKNIFFKNKKKQKIYFFCHPIDWWRQFSNIADVKITNWRAFSSQHQKILFPDNFIGEIMFKILFFLEDIFENFFSKNFQYPIIILKKK